MRLYFLSQAWLRLASFYCRHVASITTAGFIFCIISLPTVWCTSDPEWFLLAIGLFMIWGLTELYNLIIAHGKFYNGTDEAEYDFLTSNYVGLIVMAFLAILSFIVGILCLHPLALAAITFNTVIRVLNILLPKGVIMERIKRQSIDFQFFRYFLKFDFI
ncbi:hypothetical protein BDP27DRAFT_1310264 [Rhodocollybia butyracea]|uniref:Uncharacterized protein n=1 Tax=Rhodocollybia butyracea TaxID=206335 RepID=A0A9P5UG01_9AGAR|nr:hypothetical protein BDP27DRAFT_1310264 [Rhodocollybia butyracea]